MGTSKILIDGVGIDLTQDTVAANKMLSGIKAHDSNGDSVTGNIASKAAATYTPTTSDQTIAAGQYLAGAQTIKGDANLVATNIKKGVDLFGCVGTYEGTGGSGGSTNQIDTATATPASNATTVTFTGLKGTPKWFIFFPNTNVPAVYGSRRITSHIFNGTSDVGQSLISSGSGWAITYSVAYNTTDFSHTYSNGSLTLNSSGASTGGTYYNITSTLIYGY